MIQITPGSDKPIFRQIIDGIQRKTITGELQPGAKLPSVRGLALELMINSNTVVKAYTELARLGIVESRQGLGFFVAPRRQIFSDEERQKRLDTAINNFISEVMGLGYGTEELVETIRAQIGQLNLKVEDE